MTRRILVTGATGYIAKHIVLRLLDAGHVVTGSARSLARDGEIRAALAPHLAEKSALENYRTVALDLMSDDGWAEALVGQDVLMHTASPFPMRPPRNPDDVIRPAVDGARRALAAARNADVGNVVLTSSFAAIGYGEHKARYDESDWTDPALPQVGAYAASKTLAERAAWDFVETEGAGMRLAVINPVLVQGAPLDRARGTSIKIVERLVSGRDPMQAKIGFGICDVGDVAEAHLRAMDAPGAAGGRHIICSRFMWMREMAEQVKAVVPSSGVKTREAPNVLIRAFALIDPQVRLILPELGRRIEVDTSRMRDVLGITPRPAEESVRETARFAARSG